MFEVMAFAFLMVMLSSAMTIVLAYKFLKLQDENDRLRIENVSNAPPF